MYKTILKTSILLLAFAAAMPADAFEYGRGPYAFKLTGYGTIGMIEPDFETPNFIADWRVRAQFNFAIGAGRTLGLAYALDDLALYQNEWARDAFLFVEDANMGRVEVGFTDSIATKLGVGLPDVGGLRINDNSLIYKKIIPGGNIISNTTLSSGRYDLRANLVSVPTNAWQFGASIAGLSPKYNYAVDLGAKYRHPGGKTKSALSFGASFIDSPENMQTDIYSAPVTADARMQVSAGLNLQYNSMVWGLSVRAIYDENAIGAPADGIIAGTGVSYDLLKYTLSASYIFSDTGIWDDAPDFMYHTGLLSFRYKYSENVDGWISVGMTRDTPFLGAGMRATF
jgi:hypothetical protein